MVSVSGSLTDPAPLFDLVTGFPPDDAVDVTVPIPLSLAVYMTMLESTGHASELARLRKVHIEQARETSRRIQAGVVALTGSDASARARITHIVEERVPRVNGLRPHVHAFVGSTVRSAADRTEIPLNPDRLAELIDAEVFPDHLERLATATTQACGLVWDEAGDVVGPPWLAERTAALRDDDLSCRGPWPRHQIVACRR